MSLGTLVHVCRASHNVWQLHSSMSAAALVTHVGQCGAAGYTTTAAQRQDQPMLPRGPSQTDRAYCMDLVKKYDFSNYLSTLLLSSNHRDAAFAIRAYNVELAQIRSSTTEVMAGKMRYQFWSDAVELAFAGRPSRHPVVQCIADAAQRCPLLTVSLFKDMLNGRANDSKTSVAFDTVEALEDYADQTVTAVLLAVLRCAEMRSPDVDKAACHVGRAVGIATVLRSAPMLIPHGEVRFPRELLSKHNVNVRAMSAAPVGLDGAAFELGSIANTHLENARSMMLSRDAVVPLLPAVAAQRFLRQLERAKFDVFDPVLQRRDSTLPLALLWARTAGSF